MLLRNLHLLEWITDCWGAAIAAVHLRDFDDFDGFCTVLLGKLCSHTA